MFVGRKKEIVKSLSLNIDQNDVIDAPSRVTDEELLFAIEQQFLTDDSEYHTVDNKFYSTRFLFLI